jgi:transcriptional regulator with XRE-family HTH domain
MEINFDFFRETLHSELSRRQRKNHVYSLRSFARQLRMSPAALSEFLSGKRRISVKRLVKILDSLDLSPHEKEELISSIFGVSRNFAVSQPGNSRDLNVEEFSMISNWYHTAILELSQLPNFKCESRWIASQLGITSTEALLAINRLKSLELLIRNDEKKWVKAKRWISTQDKAVTSKAHRERQRQVLHKAAEALDSVHIDIRSNTSVTMAIDERKIADAKKLILQFNRKMTSLLSTEKNTKVYELVIALFPLEKKGNDL